MSPNRASFVPFAHNTEAVITHYVSDAQNGLSRSKMQQLRDQWGTNELPSAPLDPLWLVFVRQFQNPLIYLLLLAAFLIIVLGHALVDAVVIAIILLFNAVVGTIQEGRARAILQSLHYAVQADCLVIRDGKREFIKDRFLVPGDIIIISRGDLVPADARIIHADQLAIDQALLTGESEPVLKGEGVLADDTPLAERNNMIYRGTTVVKGKARAVVTATGVHTEVGKLGMLAQQVQTDVPIKAELDHVSHVVLFVIVALCSFIFVLQYLQGEPLSEIMITMITLFVSAVPEGLPAILTFVLVRGSYEMARRKVLVRGMQAVEGLGRADTIIVDKTGTLTFNQMMVQEICTPYGRFNLSGHGYEPVGTVEPQPEGRARDTLQKLALSGFLVNNVELLLDDVGRTIVKGDPTQAALMIAAYKIDPTIEKHAQAYEQLFSFPFHQEMRLQAEGLVHNNQGIIMLNGAPEEIIKRCAQKNGEVSACMEMLLDRGLRLIGSAYAECSVHDLKQAAKNPEQFVREHMPPLTLLGIAGIADAVRPEVADSIAQARETGLMVYMATGDHVKTAAHVATKTGLLQHGDVIMESKEFASLSQQDLIKRLDNTAVFARMTPQDKLRLIHAVQKKGAIVAMTGDGVNDVPAIVAADLGIAMGQTGAEVTKYAADMVLYDDSFSNILYAITFGRHIFYVLQRVMVYFFSTNCAELLIIVLASIIGLPVPLTAGQILWLNVVTDGFLDIGISCEPMEEHVLQDRSWVGAKKRLLSWDMLATSLYLALPMVLGSLWLYSQYVHQSEALARTVTLLTMALFQWFNAWNCRSLFRSLFTMHPLANVPLILTTVLVIFLQLLIMYVPFLQQLFRLVPLGLIHWLQAAGVASTIIVWSEIRKVMILRYYIPKS